MLRVFFFTHDVDVQVAQEARVANFVPLVDVVSSDLSAADGRVRLPELKQRSHRFRFRQPSGRHASADTLYVASPFEVRSLVQSLQKSKSPACVRVLDIQASRQILVRRGMPIRLGFAPSSGDPFVHVEDQVGSLDHSRTLRLAVVNEYSAAFGDSISCLTVLKELRRYLQRHFPCVEIDLLQTRFSSESNPMYLRSGLVSQVHTLPITLNVLAAYDVYIDFDFSGSVQGHERPWIDACLEACGIPPSEVPPEEKRNQFRVDCRARRDLTLEVERVRSRRCKLLLVHSLASTPIRSMPEPVALSVVSGLLERMDCVIVSALRLPFRHDRFVDWSCLSTNFERFAYLVSQVDMFVTVDTVVYHLADAFDVPGVVLFTSVSSDLRVCYYPYITGIQLRLGNRLTGLSVSYDQGDITYSESLWRDLDLDEVANELKRIVSTHTHARDAPPGS